MYDFTMSVSHTPRARVADLAPVSLPREVESRYLYQIINTVSSTLDLDRVLRAIVDLVSEAIDCHACFIYAVEPDSSLVLRAVSDPYGALVGRLRFDPGEGLSGWVAANNQPVFISENALADPRVKIVPEAEEEKYQSLCGAPLNAKSGEVIGVIALHAEAPKEFTQSDVEFLVHAASLVAGAIENARLFEETTRRLTVVEGLSDLSRAVAGATTMDALLTAVTRRAQRLLGADLCQVYVADPSGTRLVVGASWPQMPARDPIGLDELGVELAIATRRTTEQEGRRLAATLWGESCEGCAIAVPLVVAEELVGLLALRLPAGRQINAEERELTASIAGQTAIAMKNVQLIDRLTERNAIKDFLEDLAHGSATPSELADRAVALGCELDQPHLVLQAVPAPGPNTEPWEQVADALETEATRAFPGSIFDRRDSAVRGLVRLRGRDHAAVAEHLRRIHSKLNERHPLAIGLSHPCQGATSFPTGFGEAEHAVAAAAVISVQPDVVSFDDLGAYKYLLRVAQDGRVRDRRGDALRILAEYDERHRAQLLNTLEEFLKRRGNIAAAAQTLYVHPNTLRQRLRRIQDLTGLDVTEEDWLMIEIELKLLRLETALGRA